MAVAILATDTWLNHLPFVGGQRPSPFGMVDGIWYGLGAGDGAAGGGNFTISLRLSEERKEDWVYILGGIAASVNTPLASDVFVQVNTGPLIPTGAVATTVNNPSFSSGGVWGGVVNNAISASHNLSGGSAAGVGMPIFGDKRIPGLFLMMAMGAEANVDGATYQLSSWGFLIKYESFFRNVRPSLG